MKVITTHENTDFDGFSALVAAAKLFRSAYAIVPHRLNRNVQHFATFYQEQLPLSSHQDLPEETIETLILVDTQTPPQIRGLTKDTAVFIIDHHSLDEPLPGAKYDLHKTGAVTTVLVEQILSAGLPLDPLEATACLLGIYEDTGNLSYDTTTPRDLRAAAKLLEAGGNLKIVNRFLHYPLSDEQRELYEQLVQNTETIEVDDVNIMLATASANQYVEEVSTLAHRLQELYEPDALIVLVQMPDHIRLVARSTNGSIDVGRVAAHFGGGGHQRASAALIRERSLAQLREELIHFMPTAVEPTTTVRQIMSYGVHVLAPDTKVAEANALMQRYGHEGFPVVAEGELVGIITRREIDRAMQHGLDRAPVRTYVRAQGVSVSPEASVREVQSLMTEHNVGQVPVVQDGKVIGIITRTDLVKLWANGGVEQPKARVTDRLERALPEPLWELLQASARLASDMGYGLYAVGGFVRDLLLGQPNLDLDLVVEGDAITLARALASQYGGTVRSHRRFGTAKWFVEPLWDKKRTSRDPGLPKHIDFASARTEFYERPSALPIVERSSIRQDLHRRDFTINTLAICLNPEHLGEVLDFFGGLKDLKQGLIRILHSLSFVEDPTRMLRAARLEARLRFRIEERTANLIYDAVELLRRTSGERIATELLLILAEESPEVALARLQHFGILEEISRALHFDDSVSTAMVAARNTASLWGLTRQQLTAVYFCLLVWYANSDAIESMLSRLHLPRRLARHIRQVPALRQALAALQAPAPLPSEVCRLLISHTDEALAAAYTMSDNETVRSRIQRFRQEWRHVRPELDGNALREFGLRPGPAYGEVLEKLRDARLDGQVKTREEEEQLVRQWLAKDLSYSQRRKTET